MNRGGLVAVLAIALVVGVLFAVDPRLDLAISRLFYDPQHNQFAVNSQPWAEHSRGIAQWLVALVAAPAFLAVIGKLLRPNRPMLVRGRAALFLILTLALGPGVLANMVLKDHWGRSRPIDVTELGGAGRFTAWWDPRGECPTNCSFIAGEPSGAFWTLAPASLAPPQWRLLAYAGALAFGAADGALRIGAGGHFFSDVAFAGIFMFGLIWMAHGLIFRWRPTRMTDDAVERPIALAGEAIRGGLAALGRWLGGRRRKPS